MSVRKPDFFRLFVTSILLFFTGTIFLLLLSDVSYLLFPSPNVAAMKEVLTSDALREAFVLSIVTSLIAVAAGLFVAIPTAYALSRYPFPGIIVLDVIVDLLIVLPVLVIGVSILVFFRSGTLLQEWGVPLLSTIGGWVAGLGDFFIYQKPGIVLAQFFCSVSFAVRTIKAAFDEIDPRTENVARTLGCTRFQAFRRITLPLARHGIVAGAVLSWTRAYGIYGPIVLVAGAVRHRTEVLPTSIYLEISIGKLEVAIAIALVMIIMASFVLVGLRLISGKSVFGTGGHK